MRSQLAHQFQIAQRSTPDPTGALEKVALFDAAGEPVVLGGSPSNSIYILLCNGTIDVDNGADLDVSIGNPSIDELPITDGKALIPAGRYLVKVQADFLIDDPEAEINLGDAWFVPNPDGDTNIIVQWSAMRTYPFRIGLAYETINIWSVDTEINFNAGCPESTHANAVITITPV